MSDDTTTVPAPPPNIRKRITRFLFTGLAVLLPVFLTAYIVFVIYRFVDTNLGQWLAQHLSEALREPTMSPWTRIAGDVLAVVVVLGVAVSAGALMASYIGRRFIGGVQQFMLKTPGIRVIYPYVKQVTDFFLTEKKLRFHNVVAVPYPRKGTYSIGFVTGESMKSINQAVGEDMVHVFIPSSPTPITGYVVFLPRRELINLPLTVDEVLRFSISGGVLVPPREVVEAAIEGGEHHGAVQATDPAWAADD